MPYLKPNPFARKVFNPLALRFGIGGSESLEVVRRSSGGRQCIPVVPVEHEGAHYVVSARGESEWVKNCRAAGAVELGGRRMRATEVPVTERDPIIAAYRKKAGKTVDAYWKKLPDARDHPVFRLEPVS